MTVIIFLLGACFSSFISCINDQNDLFRRSRCLNCHHKLSAADLIPIVSYLLLRGRCKYCSIRIPTALLWGEILTGAAFVYIFSLNNIIHIQIALTITIFLIPLSIIDIESFTIPNQLLTLLFSCLMTGYTYLYIFHSATISKVTFEHITIKLLMILLLHIFFFLTKSIGYGDIKLFVILLIFLPIPYFIAMFFLTYLIGGFASMIFLSYKRNLKKVPLVPFITASFFVVMYVYQDIKYIYFGGFI
ncbi:prepilin peptidase [Macrococcoides canis]|uniref:prepilin peptidase n=1 Tax=Macrococcoides canis TaxID=1855823 RepID=UPI00105B3F17|nr:A24 family peptidase [Macrococcus canis]TDM23671.1 prepilin peptidase [Macrococcus canis]TDM31593.1 prepilin peptidase [Macrococcus canis]TDM34972.1 prepilin peptidase [Macrococcus canis]